MCSKVFTGLLWFEILKWNWPTHEIHSTLKKNARIDIPELVKRTPNSFLLSRCQKCTGCRCWGEFERSWWYVGICGGQRIGVSQRKLGYWGRHIHGWRKFAETDVGSQRVDFCRFTGFFCQHKCGRRQYIGCASGVHSWKTILHWKQGPKRKANCKGRKDLAWGGLDCLGEVKNHRTFYGN